jgi:hypothetical protein
MLLNSWAIALLIAGVASLFLVGGAAHTALRVLRCWQPGSDSARQIDLENQTWLAALLVQYGVVLQLLALVLLIFAADAYSRVLAGAMCAAGAFMANPFGMPALLVKLAGLFFYGFWLVLHRLDILSEHLPLTRIKFSALLFLAPLLAADVTLVFFYLFGLSPDIITSCCGVVFAPGAGDGRNLVGPLPVFALMSGFYSLAVGLLLLTMVLLARNLTRPSRGELLLNAVYGLSFAGFFILSLVVITAVISSYIYAMPAHRCPFDILQREYDYIGYPLYLALIGGSFAGISAAGTAFCAGLPGLAEPVRRFRRLALWSVLFLLPLFLLIASWSPALYLLTGGER